MKSYSDISLKYIKQNKKRSVLTILGITLAVILIFAVGTFGFSFFDSMLASERERSNFEFLLSDINKDNVDKVKNNIEVKDSSISRNDENTYLIKGTDKTACISFSNDDYYKNIFYKNSLSKGDVPKADNEVMIDQFAHEKLGLDVGDKITLVNDKNEEKEYDICGIYKFAQYKTGGVLGIEGYLNDSNLIDSNNYDIYVNLVSEKNKQDIIKDIIKEANIQVTDKTKHDNNEILYLTGNGGSSAIGKSIKYIAGFVIGIIIICAITVIYNAFNISVIERMKYYGILKAIGATPSQIKNIIFKEGFLMGLIALPIGCIIGFLGLKFGIKIFLNGSVSLLFDNFKVGFYPSVLLITAAIEIVTIFVSLIVPARKAKKVSAVDAMRNKNEIKLGKIKRRKGRLIQKIFGIEGNIAYKNLRRTPMRFILTIIALTISIVLFNVFYSFIDYAKQMTMQQFIDLSFDAEIAKQDRNTTFSDSECEKMEGLSFMSDYYKMYLTVNTSGIDKSQINSDYESKLNMQIGKNIYNDLNYQDVELQTEILYRDKDVEPLNENIDKKVSFDELNDGGVVLVDGSTTTIDGKKEIVRMTNYKVGDTIKIPKTEDNTEEGVKKAIQDGNFYEAKIIRVINREPYSGQEMTRSIELIFSQNGYEKVNKKVNPNSYLLMFNNDDDNREEAASYFEDNAESMGCMYQDIGDVRKQVDTVYSQVEFFVYSFVIIVTLISIINIYNTISTSIILRKKEFSTLKAIGMTDSQLSKSVILEGTLYGIISAVFGGALSLVLSKIMIKLGGNIGVYEYNFPIIAFLLSIVAAILVTYISTLIPLNKLKKCTIVEGISDED